ncbi:MAG: hypothetical protein IPK50_23490 [Fibrobacterota bacterium]|nr:hypothetical protein [Fibrobacterota bacterium]QQS05198.1 MAG: hypothetical protein IPK50_23490 [Fibrobacterota bacterium]
MKTKFLFPLLLLCGCATLKAPSPAGFASFEATSDKSVAVSPDELVWRVRMLDDQPVADLAFWKASLRHHLEQHGHLVVDSFPLRWEGLPAAGYETRLTVEGRESSYLVATSPRGKKILVAEAGGPSKSFAQHRSALRIALDSVRAQ